VISELSAGSSKQRITHVCGHASTWRKFVHAAEVTGRTDPAIFRETAELHSIPYTGELLDQYATTLADRYRARVGELAAGRYRAQPQPSPPWPGLGGASSRS
jgi:hypothetical protein